MGDFTVAVLASSKRSYHTAMEDNNLLSLQTKLFNDPEYSDLTIKCGDKTWHCHRAILCKRCPFFQAACGGSFLEAGTREINLVGDKPEALNVMLLFLYTAEFPEYRTTTRISVGGSFCTVIIADKYCLTTLRDHALTELIAISKKHLAGWLRKGRDIEGSIKLVRMVWQSKLDCFATAKIVVLEELANAVEHISERPEFQQLIADKKDLNLKLIKVLSKRANSVTRT